jgi:hypothetical protein
MGAWQPWIAGEGRGHGMAPFIEFSSSLSGASLRMAEADTEDP